MGLDRRLVAILFHNGINDVTKVEKYLGRKDDYLEVIIDGQLQKLKIPGILYPEDIPSENEKNIEYVEKSDSFANNLEDVVELIKKSENELFTVTTTTTIIEEENSFEEELKKTELENQEVLKSIKKETKEKLKPQTKVEKKSEKKKIKNIEPKELDDEIDNFIDSV